METRTRGKGTIDHGLQGSMGTLDDVNPTRLSKQSQGCPLTVSFPLMQPSPDILVTAPTSTVTTSNITQESIDV